MPCQILNLEYIPKYRVISGRKQTEKANNHPKSSTYIFLFSSGQDLGNAVEHNEGHYSSMIGSHSGPSDIASDNPRLYYRHPSTRLATYRLIVEMPVVAVTLATKLPMMSPSYPHVWGLNRNYCWLNHLKIDEISTFSGLNPNECCLNQIHGQPLVVSKTYSKNHLCWWRRYFQSIAKQLKD